MLKRKLRNILLNDSEYKQATEEAEKLDMSFARFIRELLKRYFKKK